ncbi:retinol dehydrogenase 14-like [Amphiura filiformis]|uniref:retinol dehydrogenase 14-like n=1 Tax=Amphiura filiformis TaxID=82378 RepID=UPI003B20FA11
MDSAARTSQEAMGQQESFLSPYLLGAGLAVGIGVFFLKRHCGGGICRSLATMRGKTVIITGSNTGLGKETALDLARREARVILACRDLDKAEKAAADIRLRLGSGQGDLVVKKLDLASLKSVNEFCDDILKTENKVDVLVNNAGIFQCPFWKTEDGFEMQFGVNYLGHFLLTNRLLDLLKKSSPSRVVMVSSKLYKRGKIDFENLNSEKQYNKEAAYSNSKLAMVLFAQELARQLEGSGVGIYTLHPGVVRTELGRHFPPIMLRLAFPLMWLIFKSPVQGAQTNIYCSVAEELEGVSGRYYGDCAEKPFPEVKNADEAVAKKLWEVSEKMTGLA